MSGNKKITESISIETFKTFYSKISYEELYSLEPSVFFNQIMIRQRYFRMAACEYTDKNKSTFLPLFELMLNGEIILEENIFKKYTPENISIHTPYAPRGVKPLSFEKSVSISSDLLGLVDKGLLTLKEEPKSKEHPAYLAYLPKRDAMRKNVFHEKFTGNTYQEVLHKTYDCNENHVNNIILEVDIKTPEDELLKTFQGIVRAHKERSLSIKKATPNIRKLIKKCQDYRVIEAFDIMNISSVLGVRIKQKEMVEIIYLEMGLGWSEDDYRKKTKTQMDIIFDQAFYSQYLKR